LYRRSREFKPKTVAFIHSRGFPGRNWRAR
jgi:hypothetical protein